MYIYINQVDLCATTADSKIQISGSEGWSLHPLPCSDVLSKAVTTSYLWLIEYNLIKIKYN